MAMAMAIASAVVAAASAINTAKNERNAARHNAAMAERNKVITQQQTHAELLRQRRLASRAMGGIRAGYAASGVTLEGSPLDLLESSVAEAELDYQNIEYSGAVKSEGYEIDADLNRSRASNEMRTGYMNAASELLSGASKAYSMSRKQ